MSESERRVTFEYPFSRKWVYACFFLAGLSIVFAAFFLSDAEPVELFTFPVHPIFLYFLYAVVFTIIMFELKLYIHTRSAQRESKELYESHLSGVEEEPMDMFKRWSFILVLALTFAAFLTPIALSYLLGPLWSFIAIAGFIPAMTVSEIILFFYSKKKST